MTGGSLGLRSGSYGSLQQHLQIGVSPIQTNSLSAAVRKPSKMLKEKEKEKLLHWIFKFAGRKKVGMLFLCAVSAAVFIWVLCIAKACPVCYLPVEDAVALMPKVPSPSPIVTNLNYIYGENLSRSEFGGSDFGGYPSLQQRNDSYDIKESMNVHCGFFRGAKPGHETGFDMDNSVLHEMEQCGGVVVASAIFGNYDIIQQPKNISEAAKKNVCFYMFVDEETEAYMKNSSILDNSQRIGLWRIVVVHNLPYTDARRNGKVPKLLLHRIFPNARYSLWIDGKLELLVDPYQILERGCSIFQVFVEEKCNICNF